MANKATTGQKPPRIYVRSGETYDDAVKRWRPRWLDYVDFKVMASCLYQASFPSAKKHRHFYRAFYGVPMPFVVEVLTCRNCAGMHTSEQHGDTDHT